MTLGKLEQPQLESDTPLLSLAAWLDALRLRNRHQPIDWFLPDELPDQKIPAALFDCVVDNLLDNALRKQQTEHDISIFVKIDAEPLCVTVCDSGDAIPEAIAASLMHRVIAYENCLGVCLYQAAP